MSAATDQHASSKGYVPPCNVFLARNNLVQCGLGRFRSFSRGLWGAFFGGGQKHAVRNLLPDLTHISLFLRNSRIMMFFQSLAAYSHSKYLFSRRKNSLPSRSKINRLDPKLSKDILIFVCVCCSKATISDPVCPVCHLSARPQKEWMEHHGETWPLCSRAIKRGVCLLLILKTAVFAINSSYPISIGFLSIARTHWCRLFVWWWRSGKNQTSEPVGCQTSRSSAIHISPIS